MKLFWCKSLWLIQEMATCSISPLFQMSFNANMRMIDAKDKRIPADSSGTASRTPSQAVSDSGILLIPPVLRVSVHYIKDRTIPVLQPQSKYYATTHALWLWGGYRYRNSPVESSSFLVGSTWHTIIFTTSTLWTSTSFSADSQPPDSSQGLFQDISPYPKKHQIESILELQ